MNVGTPNGRGSGVLRPCADTVPMAQAPQPKEAEVILKQDTGQWQQADYFFYSLLITPNYGLSLPTNLLFPIK